MSPRLRAILAANPDILADAQKAVSRLLPDSDREFRGDIDLLQHLAGEFHNALVSKGES